MTKLVVGSNLRKYFLEHVTETPLPGIYFVHDELKVFKKIYTTDSYSTGIANLRIPKGATVFASHSAFDDTYGFRDNRKMRASIAICHSIADLNGRAVEKGVSLRVAGRVKYAKNSVIRPGGIFDSGYKTCSTGIHFFLNVDDAIAYY